MWGSSPLGFTNVRDFNPTWALKSFSGTNAYLQGYLN